MTNRILRNRIPNIDIHPRPGLIWVTSEFRRNPSDAGRAIIFFGDMKMKRAADMGGAECRIALTKLEGLLLHQMRNDADFNILIQEAEEGENIVDILAKMDEKNRAAELKSLESEEPKKLPVEAEAEETKDAPETVPAT